MSHDIQIRLARKSDLELLGDIETAGDAQFPTGYLPGKPGSDNAAPEELEAGLKAELLWVAEISTSLVGFQLASIHGNRLHLLLIVVLPEYQGRGLGCAFLELLALEAQTRGLTKITLTTFEDIPWNAPWYIRRGFRVLCKGELEPDLENILAAEAAAGLSGRLAMARDLSEKDS